MCTFFGRCGYAHVPVAKTLSHWNPGNDVYSNPNPNVVLDTNGFFKVDAYRNKMRTSMLAAGQEASEIPKHFDTRRGKRRFLERARQTENDAPSAAQRSAEEVEG